MTPVPLLDTVLDVAGSVLDRVLPDPTARQEAKQRLAELAQAGALEREHLAIERVRLHQSDRADARRMQRETAGLVAPTLAVATFVGFFAVLGCMMFVEVPEGSGAVFNVLLGSLGTLLAQVAHFYFGSSDGSKRKQDVIDQAMQRGVSASRSRLAAVASGGTETLDWRVSLPPEHVPTPITAEPSALGASMATRAPSA
ncbi:MAG: hypothetical protein AAF624_00520 [Bacteroidota bacterium]